MKKGFYILRLSVYYNILNRKMGQGDVGVG